MGRVVNKEKKKGNCACEWVFKYLHFKYICCQRLLVRRKVIWEIATLPISHIFYRNKCTSQFSMPWSSGSPHHHSLVLWDCARTGMWGSGHWAWAARVAVCMQSSLLTSGCAAFSAAFSCYDFKLACRKAGGLSHTSQTPPAHGSANVAVLGDDVQVHGNAPVMLYPIPQPTPRFKSHWKVQEALKHQTDE